MFFFFLLMFVFMAIKEYRLMTVSLLCSMGLAMYLKHAASGDLNRLPHNSNTKERSMRVAFFEPSSTPEEYPAIGEAIIASKADIVALQGILSDEEVFLKKTLATSHPYESVYTGPDGLLCVLFSETPFSKVDTIPLGDYSLIKAVFRPDSIPVDMAFLLACTPSREVTPDYEKMVSFMNAAAVVANQTTQPYFFCGNLRLVPWSREILSFRTATKLEDSRKDLTGGIFSVPEDHIFYSAHLDCMFFRSARDASGVLPGLIGSYQYINELPHAETPSAQF